MFPGRIKAKMGTSAGFYGIIRKVTINLKAIDLKYPPTFAGFGAIAWIDVVMNASSNQCLLAPCHNEGSCTVTQGSRLCKCQRHFFGSSCEQRGWYCIVFSCILLPCLALHCIVLYCVALYCIALYCIALYCTALQSIVLYCIALYCIALYCSIHRVSYRIVFKLSFSLCDFFTLPDHFCFISWNSGGAVLPQ